MTLRQILPGVFVYWRTESRLVRRFIMGLVLGISIGLFTFVVADLAHWIVP